MFFGGKCCDIRSHRTLADKNMGWSLRIFAKVFQNKSDVFPSSLCAKNENIIL